MRVLKSGRGRWRGERDVAAKESQRRDVQEEGATAKDAGPLETGKGEEARAPLEPPEGNVAFQR